jgi:ubiquinone/menaquinone biosynthesis C-methylase UbiE
MKEINLLKSIPNKKRNIHLRKKLKNLKTIEIANKFGKDYFDGKRSYGYGGYYYDGRWKNVAKEFIKFYKLKPGDKVLDVGCAKGFFVKDLIDKKIDAYGIDISKYAIDNCHSSVTTRLSVGNAINIPYPDNSFKLVFSINTLHNLKKKQCTKAIQEIMRVSYKHKYIQVDAYKNLNEKKIFQDWVLTAKFHTYCYKWKIIFKSLNYNGEYYWTFV